MRRLHVRADLVSSNPGQERKNKAYTADENWHITLNEQGLVPCVNELIQGVVFCDYLI